MQSSITRESLQASLTQYFGSIPDPRVERTRAHQLVDIIAIALFAILSGADGWVAIETYGLAKQEWLETFLNLPNGIPSHDTFARVFSRLDLVVLESSFQQWVRLLTSTLGAQVIAIDGKTLKGSYDREQGVKALQMVSAWASGHRLVLGQCAVATKSNEITAIPVLLEQLDLSGAIITIDAMGAQTTIAQQIHQAQADYILALKKNHPTLSEFANAWFERHAAQSGQLGITVHYSACEGEHHRIETRTLWPVPVTEVFPQDRIAA